jgi:hypothetical protein
MASCRIYLNRYLREASDDGEDKAGSMSEKVGQINKKLLPAHMPIEAKTKVSKN